MNSAWEQKVKFGRQPSRKVNHIDGGMQYGKYTCR